MSKKKKKMELASVKGDKVKTTIVYYKNMCFYNKHSIETSVVIINTRTRIFVFQINNSFVTSLSFKMLSHWNTTEYFVLQLVPNISEIYLLLHHHSASANEWRVCCSSHQDTDDTAAVTETFGINYIFIPLIAQVDFVLYTGLSKKMDGIWNRYNLKSTGRIYTFCVLKCSEKFKVLDLP